MTGRTITSTAAALAAAAVALAAAPVAGAAAGQTPTNSVVAQAIHATISVYRSPAGRSRLMTLSNPTPNGSPRVFLVKKRAPGWEQVYLPVRPNGSTGWVRDAESRINWASHVDFVYDLIRGCNPAPGAWTTFKPSGKPEDGVEGVEAQKLYLFDSKKIIAPTFGTVRASGGASKNGYSLNPKRLAVTFAGNCRRWVLYACTRSL